MTVEIDILGTDYPSPSNAANTNWAAVLVALLQALADGVNTVNDDVEAVADDVEALEAAVGPPTWLPLTLINSWVSEGPAPGYYKDSTGRVWLRGGISGGVSGTAPWDPFPVGYRPPAAAPLVLDVLSDGGVATLTILSTGAVQLNNLTAGSDVATYAGFEGKSFSTVA